MCEKDTVLIDQLFQMVRKQDDLTHKWIATLLAVHGGAATGVGFVWSSDSSSITVVLGICVLAIVATIGTYVCCSAAIGEMRWQGTYISYIRKMDVRGVVYEGVPEPIPTGMGREAKLISRAGIVLYLLWGGIVAGSVLLKFFGLK